MKCDCGREMVEHYDLYAKLVARTCKPCKKIVDYDYLTTKEMTTIVAVLMATKAKVAKPMKEEIDELIGKLTKIMLKRYDSLMHQESKRYD